VANERRFHVRDVREERLGLQVIRDRAGEPVAFVAPAEELDLLIYQKDDESEILAPALKRLSSGQLRFPSAKVKSLLMSLETLAPSKEVDASDVEMLIKGLSGE